MSPQTLIVPASPDHAAATAASLPNGLTATELDSKTPQAAVSVPVRDASPQPKVEAPPAERVDPLTAFKEKLRELVPLMHAAGITELRVEDDQVSLVRTVINKGLVTAEG